MKPEIALTIYRDLRPFSDLRDYADWLEMSPSPEKEWTQKYLNDEAKIYSPYSDNYPTGLEFFADLYNSLKELILTKKLKKSEVLFRGIRVQDDETFNDLISKREITSNKFDSFTSCSSVAFEYSEVKNNDFSIVFVTFFPKGSHLLGVEHQYVSLHERLTLPGNVYSVIEKFEHFVNLPGKVTPKRVTIILTCLIEENGVEFKCNSSIPKELREIEYYLQRKYEEKDQKYFSLMVENLKFDKPDTDKIIGTLIEEKDELIFENYNSLIFDDILNRCLRDKDDDGKFIYPNVIFEIDRNLEIDSSFPLGYRLDFSIEKNKLQKKYYLVKVSRE